MMAQIIPERLSEVMNVQLQNGGHQPSEKEFCVMEAVAYVAGEPWSDEPKCVARPLSRFFVSLNDTLDDETRQLLKPLIPRLVGTGNGLETQVRWAFTLADFSTRFAAPMALERAAEGLRAAKVPGDHAEKLLEAARSLRALQPVVDAASADSARRAADSASWAADSASGAAGSASGAAASASGAADSARRDAWRQLIALVEQRLPA